MSCFAKFKVVAVEISDLIAGKSSPSYIWLFMLAAATEVPADASLERFREKKKELRMPMYSLPTLRGFKIESCSERDDC